MATVNIPAGTLEESNSARLKNISAATAGAPAGSTLSGDVIHVDNPAIQQADPFGVQAAHQAPQTFAPSAPAGPTIQDQLAGITAGAGEAQSILDGLIAAENAPGPSLTGFQEVGEPTPFDQEAADREAFQRQLKLHQGDIDATNQVYDQLLNEARLEGQGRLGSQRAGAARGGLLGSDFAGAQKDKTQKFNTDINRSIQAERRMKIGAIMSTVRSSAVEEATAKREAQQADAETYSEFLANKKTRRENHLQQIAGELISQGFNIEEMDEEELAAIVQDGNFEVDDLKAAYHTARAEGAAGTDDKKYTLKEGETLVNAAGEELASIPGEAVVFKEGDVVVNADGTTTKIGKTSAPKAGGGADKVFSAKDMPGDIRSDLLDDIQAGQTFEQLINLYPEVNTETLQDFHGQFAPLEETTSFGEKVSNFWDAFTGEK